MTDETAPARRGRGSELARSPVMMSASEREQSRLAELSVIWHDLECGAYGADLPTWERLAEQAEGPVLDLGCGTGRVALRLARRGHRVVGLDLDPGLVAAFEERAAGLPAEAVAGNARDFALDAEFGLVIGPMQLAQLLGGERDRVACLECVARHLAPGGRAAFAIVELLPEPVDAPPPLPDARELDGWVYSSLPLETLADGGRIVVRRLRQAVSPEGELSEALDEVALGQISAAQLEREAGEAGLLPVGREEVAATDDHIGSTVVVLERGS